MTTLRLREVKSLPRGELVSAGQDLYPGYTSASLSLWRFLNLLTVPLFSANVFVVVIFFCFTWQLKPPSGTSPPSAPSSLFSCPLHLSEGHPLLPSHNPGVLLTLPIHLPQSVSSKTCRIHLPNTSDHLAHVNINLIPVTFLFNTVLVIHSFIYPTNPSWDATLTCTMRIQQRTKQSSWLKEPIFVCV